MIACVSGEEHSFIETGQPQSSDLACRHELKRVWVKADIGITTLWHRHGNNLINCTEISLMNSYVVISMRSNSRNEFQLFNGPAQLQFWMPSHFIFPCKLSAACSSISLQLSAPLAGLPLHVCWAEGQVHLAMGSRLATSEMKTRSNKNGGMISLWWLHLPSSPNL